MKKNGFKLTKKGIIALAVLIILLAGAIWLNIRLNGENPADGGSADGTSAPGKSCTCTGDRIPAYDTCRGGVRCRNGSKRKRETDGACQQHGTGICD